MILENVLLIVINDLTKLKNKMKSTYIIISLIIVTLLLQFIQTYYPNDLFFYGQCGILGIMLVMLVFKKKKDKQN